MASDLDIVILVFLILLFIKEALNNTYIIYIYIIATNIQN